MPIDDDIIARARRLEVSAVTTIFDEYYPMVHRIAHGLTGRKAVGREIERFVLRRAFRVIPNWADEGAPKRWFTHHAVLASRRVPRADPADPSDLLLDGALTSDLEYVAFLRAIRSLPIQQREAFILTHCEQFRIRDLAIAMDCSNHAATTHLSAADTALRTIGANHFDSLCKQLVDRYRALVPTEHLLLPSMSLYVARRIWPRRILKAVQWIILIAVLAAIAYSAYKLWPMLEF